MELFECYICGGMLPNRIYVVDSRPTAMKNIDEYFAICLGCYETRDGGIDPLPPPVLPAVPNA